MTSYENPASKRSKIKQSLPGSWEVLLQDLTVWEGIPPFGVMKTAMKETKCEAFDNAVAYLIPCILYPYNMHQR
jgi:hypothetical protein